MAMGASEEGRRAEALEWIAKAKEIVGETAEVLCREAIVYSYFDQPKMQAQAKAEGEDFLRRLRAGLI